MSEKGCECFGWRWDMASITDNGRWPLPDHHPGCKNYNAKPYKRLTVDGTSVIIEPHELEDLIKDADGPYEVSDINLTEHQVETLREFDGF